MAMGTPTMYVDLLAKKSELNLTVDSLKFIVAGGSPISPQLVIDLMKSLGIKKIKVDCRFFKPNPK